ncbi:MAG: lipid A biosynthesis lauroyl acyltransferase [Xanthobacteraceae bacterium]
MRTKLRHAARRTAWRIKSAFNIALGQIAILLLKALRRLDPESTVRLSGRWLRRIGPWLPENRVGRANLRAAFPDWPPAKIEDVLGGVWDNLGRLGAEFVHLDHLFNFDPARMDLGRIEFSPETAERFLRLRDAKTPALFFAAHLANWELPALAAAAFGLKTVVLFRPPNMPNVSRFVLDVRSSRMGRLVPIGLDAPVRVAEAIKEGAHAGMLVDQYYTRGVDVTFFGRRTKANPFIARLARHTDGPIHGVRVVRLPEDRFRVDLTEAITVPRGAKGEIDVAATMQLITSMIEGWIREHPEQWLWLHRRWR